MTARRIITRLVAAGGVVASMLAGGAPGAAAHSSAGSPAASPLSSGPYALAVAVDATAGRALVLSASISNETFGPTGQGYLSVLDARTGTLLRTVTVGMGSAALLVDERTGHAFVASAGSINMVDTRTGRVLRTLTFGELGPLAMGVDARLGRLFVETHSRCASNVCTGTDLRVLDSRKGVLLRTVPWLGGPGDQMAVDEPAGRIFITNLTVGDFVSAGLLLVLDARAAEPLCARLFSMPIVGLAVDEARARVWVKLSAPHRYGVSILDARRDAILRTIILGGTPVARSLPLAWTGILVDERAARAFVIASGSYDGFHGELTGSSRVTTLDARSGRVLRTAAVAGLPLAAAVDARAGRLLVAGGRRGGGWVSVLDTHSGALVRSVRTGPLSTFPFFPTVPLAVDSRTDRAFFANLASNSVIVLETRSGTVLRTVALHPAPASH